MSRYRMCFFNDRHNPLVASGPSMGIHGNSEEDAICMSHRVWEGLAGEETAMGYSLVDSHTGLICHIELR
jgi:hypothetical protein